jgi:hypothetical protein
MGNAVDAERRRLGRGHARQCDVDDAHGEVCDPRDAQARRRLRSSTSRRSTASGAATRVSVLFTASKGAVVKMTRSRWPRTTGPRASASTASRRATSTRPWSLPAAWTDELREARRMNTLLQTEGTGWDIGKGVGLSRVRPGALGVGHHPVDRRRLHGRHGRQYHADQRRSTESCMAPGAAFWSKVAPNQQTRLCGGQPMAATKVAKLETLSCRRRLAELPLRQAHDRHRDRGLERVRRGLRRAGSECAAIQRHGAARRRPECA